MDSMIKLGNSKFVKVSEFKKKPLVDIREYYNDDEGKLKPGRKGISLTVKQWKALVKDITKIDEEINEILETQDKSDSE